MLDLLPIVDPWLIRLGSVIIILTFAYTIGRAVARKAYPPVRARIGWPLSCCGDWYTRRIAFNHLKGAGWVRFADVSNPKSTAIVTRFGIDRRWLADRWYSRPLEKAIVTPFGIDRRWLTDGRYSRAIKKLREQKKVISAPVFSPSSSQFSREATKYMLVPPGQDWQEAEESAIIEAKCEHFAARCDASYTCDHPNRYASRPSFAKATDSGGVRRYGGGRYLTEDAPPCALCFQRTPKDIKCIDYEIHVTNLLEHDFGSYNQEHLAPVIIQACIETDCDETLPFVKRVVKEALKLSQLAHGRDESEIQAELEAYIRAQQEEPE